MISPREIVDVPTALEANADGYAEMAAMTQRFFRRLRLYETAGPPAAISYRACPPSLEPPALEILDRMRDDLRELPGPAPDRHMESD